MGLSGLVGSGASKGLEEILTQQLLAAKFKEQQRAQQAQEAAQQQRIALDTRRQDFEESTREEDVQQSAISDMHARGDKMDARMTRLQNEEDVASKRERIIAGLSRIPNPAGRLAAELEMDGVNLSAGQFEKPVDPEEERRKGLEDYESKKKIDARYREPSGGGSAEQVFVMRGGKAIPIPKGTMQAGDMPYDRSRTGDRPMLSGDANDIADIDNSLGLLDGLRESIGKTGASSKLGAVTPNWASELTGYGVDAKQRQALIDGAKQIIGKTLEGGVLRKEDEAKYARILPTIGEPPEVAAAKIDGLKKAIQRQRETKLEAMESAGFVVEGFKRGSAPNPAGGTVKMQAPTGPGGGGKPDLIYVPGKGFVKPGG